MVLLCKTGPDEKPELKPKYFIQSYLHERKSNCPSTHFMQGITQNTANTNVCKNKSSYLFMYLNHFDCSVCGEKYATWEWSLFLLTASVYWSMPQINRRQHGSSAHLSGTIWCNPDCSQRLMCTNQQHSDFPSWHVSYNTPSATAPGESPASPAGDNLLQQFIFQTLNGTKAQRQELSDLFNISCHKWRFLPKHVTNTYEMCS